MNAQTVQGETGVHGQAPLLLSREAVAELLGGVPSKSVDYLHRVGLMPAVRVGKFNKWKPETVRRYVDSLDPS